MGKGKGFREFGGGYAGKGRIRERIDERVMKECRMVKERKGGELRRNRRR